MPEKIHSLLSSNQFIIYFGPTVYISGASREPTIETELAVRARRAALAERAQRPLDVLLDRLSP